MGTDQEPPMYFVLIFIKKKQALKSHYVQTNGRNLDLPIDIKSQKREQ